MGITVASAAPLANLASPPLSVDATASFANAGRQAAEGSSFAALFALQAEGIAPEGDIPRTDFSRAGISPPSPVLTRLLAPEERTRPADASERVAALEATLEAFLAAPSATTPKSTASADDELPAVDGAASALPPPESAAIAVLAAPFPAPASPGKAPALDGSSGNRTSVALVLPPWLTPPQSPEKDAGLAPQADTAPDISPFSRLIAEHSAPSTGRPDIAAAITESSGGASSSPEVAGGSNVSPDSPPPVSPLSAPAGKSPPPETSTSALPAIRTPVGDAHWGHELGNRVVWMARHEQQTAQIQITPANLGPLQITLNLSGDQLNLSMASPFGEVRQALESSLPGLRDALAGAGINLGQANVGEQFQRPPQTPLESARHERSAGEPAILGNSDTSDVSAGVTPLRAGRGLVDLFA